MPGTCSKQRLLELLEQLTAQLSWDDMVCFTAQSLSATLGMSRNLASQYLNEYSAQGSVIKITTRPVYFFHREKLCERLHSELRESSYPSTEELRKAAALNPTLYSPFQQMVGASGSLRYCVEQCKAAVGYPGGGLPLLIQGPTGTGKSVLAQLTYEYAMGKGILEPTGRFVTVNCSEYANNPELLLTNLFGHRRGAYTGADRDRKGLIELADGGVLFLDEVHCLKSECQEKLFLFMDKGIYHMVGDNEKWYSSKVRLIFATTESPECALLRTLLRRIPIVTYVPALENRPPQDKRELIYHILCGEAQSTGCSVCISALAYQTVLRYMYAGNVGQLVNTLKASIANALVRTQQETSIEIRLCDLPAYLISGECESVMDGSYSDEELLNLQALFSRTHTDNRLLSLGRSLLHLHGSCAGCDEDFWPDARKLLDRYTDRLFFDEGEVKTPREELMLGAVTNIFNGLARKYSIGCLSNNEFLIMVRFLSDNHSNAAATEGFSAENHAELEDILEGMRRIRPVDYAIAMDAAQLVEQNLNRQLDRLGTLVLTMYIRSFGNEGIIGTIGGIILAHGYSTAGSIAQAANHLLNGHVFDAIDMPVESSPQNVVQKLEEYLKRMNCCADIIIMVDMGSLELIYKELSCPQQMNVGIINNITTRMALHIGSMMQQGLTVRRILEKASAGNVSRYTVLENRKFPDALLTVCATGIGTAEKLAKLIEDSLPRRVDLTVMPYDYESLRSMGRDCPVFEKYNVQMIAGTLDPCIEGMEFVSVEELVESSSGERLSQLLLPYLTTEELGRFNDSIVRNFSLQNLLDYLIILNPEKIITHVEQIVGDLQKRLRLSIDSAAKVGLYLHISCLIERLITDRYIASYENVEKFESEHSDFIAAVRECFAGLERSYSVAIPVSEIGYIYEYLYRRAPEVSNSLETVSMFND